LNPGIIKGLREKIGDFDRNLRGSDNIDGGRSLSGIVESIISEFVSGGIGPFGANVDDVVLAKVVKIDGSGGLRIGDGC